MMQRIRNVLHTHALFFCAALVAVFTIEVYIPALRNDFVNWDDMLYVYENPRIRSLDISFLRWAFLDFHISNWHPLTWVSHAGDYALWGLNPGGHHFTSVLLHGLNAGILVVLVAGLLGAAVSAATSHDKEESSLSRDGIFAAATVTGLLFGIHPLHVESVAWVSERKDVLSAFFFMLSIVSYLRYVAPDGAREGRGAAHSPGSSRRYFASLGFFFLALLSKPMAFTLPVVLLILDWYPLGRFRKEKVKAVLVEKIPYTILSLLSTILTLKAQHSTESVISISDVSIPSRVLMAFKALVLYLVKMVFPFGLSPFYPYPRTLPILSLEYLLPIAVVAVITVSSVAAVKKQKCYLALWGYYFVTLLPVLGIVQVGSQSMADRYTYLPSVAPFLLFGLGAASLLMRIKSSPTWSGKGLVMFCLAGVLCMGTLLTATIRQIGVWKDGIALWSRVIEMDVNVPMAYARRGDVFAAQGQFEDSLRDYTAAIRIGLTQFSSEVSSYYSARAILYARAGKYNESLQDFHWAIRTGLSPAFDNYYNRGYVYEQLGRYEEALQDYSHAAYLNPRSHEAYNNRGHAYEQLGRYEESLRDYTESIQLNPISSRPYYNRGNIYAKLGRLEAALNDYTIAIQLSPEPVVDYYRSRALVFERSGRHQEAMQDSKIIDRLTISGR